MQITCTKQERESLINLISTGHCRNCVFLTQCNTNKTIGDCTTAIDKNIKWTIVEPKYICIAKCPECEESHTKRCIATLSERQEKEEKFHDYCPCGNIDKWEEIK